MWNKAYVLHLSVRCCFTFQILFSFSNKNDLMHQFMSDFCEAIVLCHFCSYLSFSPSFFVSSSFCCTSCDIMVSFCVSMLSWIFWSTTKALWLSNSNFCCSLSSPTQRDMLRNTKTTTYWSCIVLIVQHLSYQRAEHEPGPGHDLGHWWSHSDWPLPVGMRLETPCRTD